MSRWHKINESEMPKNGDCVFLHDQDTMRKGSPEGDYPTPVRFENAMGGVWVDWFYGTEIHLGDWTHWRLANT